MPCTSKAGKPATPMAGKPSTPTAGKCQNVITDPVQELSRCWTLREARPSRIVPLIKKLGQILLMDFCDYSLPDFDLTQQK
jgi:hypothetical protein